MTCHSLSRDRQKGGLPELSELSGVSHSGLSVSFSVIWATLPLVWNVAKLVAGQYWTVFNWPTTLCAQASLTCVSTVIINENCIQVAGYTVCYLFSSRHMTVCRDIPWLDVWPSVEWGGGDILSFFVGKGAALFVYLHVAVVTSSWESENN